MNSRSFALTAALILSSLCGFGAPRLKIAYFQADVTPSVGIPVAYAPTRSIVDSLSARGVVISPEGQKPVVLCVVDWLLISNESSDLFRSYLAKAAGTTPDRVSVHTVHQHDTPWCDQSSEKALAANGLGGIRFDLQFLDACMRRTAEALARALPKSKVVKKVGFGEAKVEKVASNRRILGSDGKVRIVRFSSSRDSAAIQAPEGLIDPFLKSVSFWDGSGKPIVVLNYYATHPQSYYGQGDVNPEFIGMARNARHNKSGIPQLFFIGAAGNIAAGKYNNGSPEMRQVLADRIEKALDEAFENTVQQAAPEKIRWQVASLRLPLAGFMVADSLKNQLADTSKDFNTRFAAARQLAWLERNKRNAPVVVTSLQLGGIRLLQLPGEPFIEYQLGAQQYRPGEKVCTAAYGDGGMVYIGTSVAYSQGGYEVDPRVNATNEKAEAVLTRAIRDVMKP